jgi:hypothetical protein
MKPYIRPNADPRFKVREYHVLLTAASWSRNNPVHFYPMSFQKGHRPSTKLRPDVAARRFNLMQRTRSVSRLTSPAPGTL